MSLRFIVVVPVFESAPWIGRCLDSITSQTWPDKRVVCVVDPSKDKTLAKAREFQRDRGVLVVENFVRMGSVANCVAGTERLGGCDEDVVVIVDGDDWLATPAALDRVAREYSDPTCWLTYGSHDRTDGWSPDLGVYESDDFRGDPVWRASHLKTFKLHLWNRVSDDDLIDSEGGYFKCCQDRVIMYPMLEIAGRDRIRFIPDRIYTYNAGNPHRIPLSVDRSERNRVLATILSRCPRECVA